MQKASELIEKLKLIPHPEGGFYREFYRSEHLLAEKALPKGFQNTKNLGSIIYYMLKSNDVSAYHKLRSDEIWHFHTGSPFILHLIDTDGNYKKIYLGNSIHLREVPCYVIPAGFYFGAEVSEENSYALASCTVLPGFSFEDFEMPTADKLMSIFPHLEQEIKHLSK